MKSCIWVIATVAALLSPAALARERIVVLYSYHSAPPFAIGNNQGLVYDLGAYLQHKIGRPLRVMDVPRPRLDKEMQHPDFNDAVLLVSPLWFNDANETSYLWTETVIADVDLVVSPQQKPVDYSAPDSLKGHSVGIVRGYRYPMFETLISEGEVTRIDTNKEESNLKMLTEHRFDATVIARSAADYLIPELGLEGKLYIATTPVNRYKRRILVGKGNLPLRDQLNRAIAGMAKDPAWQAILKKYRMQGN